MHLVSVRAKPPPARPMRNTLASWTIAALGSTLGPSSNVAVGRDVEIRPVAGKGFGAFATREIPAGAFLGRYTGRLLSAREAEEAWEGGKTSGEYFAFTDSPFNPGSDELYVYDAEDAGSSNWPRFINHSRRRENVQNLDLRLPVALLPGTDPVRLPLGLYVQTLRRIKAGEELLLDYGSAYWTTRGIPPLDPLRIAIDLL